MELMKAERIISARENTAGNSDKRPRQIRIRAHCPQDDSWSAGGSILVVHGGEMLKNGKLDIRWAVESHFVPPGGVAAFETHNQRNET